VNKKAKAKNDLMKMLTDDINNSSDNKQNDMIAIDLLTPYGNHPFRLYEGDRLSDMVRSIKEMGVLLPIIVRPVDSENDKYEILSGHNRVNAARAAGLNEVPTIIKYELSDDEARLIVTETNLVQRSFADLTHSERAVALKYHMDAIKSQGKRTDIINEINSLINADKIDEKSTSYQVDTKLISSETVGSKYGLSSASVARYVRISYLNDSLKSRVDSEEISFIPAVSLSYLLPDEQTERERILDRDQQRDDMKKAALLREYSKDSKLTSKMIEDILSGAAPKKRNRTPLPVQSLKIGGKILSKYFKPEQKPEEIQAELFEALEFFRAKSEE